MAIVTYAHAFSTVGNFAEAVKEFGTAELVSRSVVFAFTPLEGI